MAETINESVAREEASVQVLVDRMNTLESAYTEKYDKLKAVNESHPDCFMGSFKLVSFDTAKELIPETKNKRKTLETRINKISEFYVKLMGQYEHIKDTHPEWL